MKKKREVEMCGLFVIPQKYYPSFDRKKIYAVRRYFKALEKYVLLSVLYKAESGHTKGILLEFEQGVGFGNQDCYKVVDSNGYLVTELDLDLD